MNTDALTFAEQPSLIEIQLPGNLSLFNNWLLENILPYAKGNVLEMDSGLGEMSALLSEQNLPVHLSEMSKQNRDKLRERFDGVPSIRSIRNIDLNHADFKSIYAAYEENFSAIIASNVSAHGFYDKTSIVNATHLLQKSGCLIVIIPACAAPYHGLDKSAEGWKKYNRTGINKILGTGLEIMKVRFFNITENRLEGVGQHLGLAALVIAKKTK